MNHYLANLVDRNFGQTAVIQPRPISRFESQATFEPAVDLMEQTTDAGISIGAINEAERPLSDYSLQPETIQLNPRRGRSEPQSQIPSQTGKNQADLHALSARLDDLGESLDTFRRSRKLTAPVMPVPVTKTQVRSGQSQTAVTKSPLHERLVHVAKLAPSPTSDRKQANLGATTSQAQDSEERDVASVDQWPQGQVIEQAPMPPLSPEADSRRGKSGKRLLPQPSTTITPSTISQLRVAAEAAPSRIRPQILSSAPPAATPIKQKTETELPPTINVTIGRIEVKTTPPLSADKPKPNKRPRPKSTVMSLDEYLRRRDGGSG